MDDTISRQAAIDVARKCPVKEITPAYTLIDKAEVMTELMMLPSAAPEAHVIKLRMDIDKDAILEAWKDTTFLPPENDRWIPVTERMPEEYTRVIGYMAWKAMTTIEYQHGRWYSIDHLEPLPDEAVSHWMPLPKPPKEGDE